MSIKPLLYPALAILLLSTGACNLSKWVPEGEYRLSGNKVCVEDREVDGPVKDIIKQKPAPVLPNWIYSLGNPRKEKGFAKWISKQGTRPTVLIPIQAERTAQQIGFYYFGKGYFKNKSGYEICRDSARQKATVIYTVVPGPQYHLREIDELIPSPAIRDLVAENMKDREFETGDPYDETRLEAERERLAQLFRANGHYGFSKDLIRYEADTAVGEHQVDLTLIISDPVTEQDGISVNVQHKPWTIRDVYIDYTFDYLETDRTFRDTIEYAGYRFLIHDEVRYKPRLITRAVHFGPGMQYNSEDVRNTYSHLGNLGVFNATEIEFIPIRDSAYTLDAHVRLTPTLVQTITTQLDLTNTSGNWGVGGVLTLLNRNLFNGGEILDVSLKGGMEAQVNTADNNSLFNTYELGAEVGMNFSRHFIPLDYLFSLPKKAQPTSRISTSVGMQTRVEFQRLIYKLGMTHTWKFQDVNTVQVKLPDLNYVNLIQANSNYINSLIFRTGFQDNLIAAASVSVIHAPPDNKEVGNFQFLRVSLESSGYFVSLYDKVYELPYAEDSESKMMFGVPYAQYLKFDLDFRHYINITRNQRFVFRTFAGLTWSYGNTPYLPPFEKNHLAGGSNDIRAWTAYRLGPGAFPNNVFDTVNYAAVGPIKLMLNLEYRFKIIGNLHGALFSDMGNVWLFDRDYSDADLGVLNDELVGQTVLKASTFLEQSAVGTGIGIRYDFGFFQLRLDGGIKVWDPSEPEGSRYVLPGLRWNNVTYNFALGYPF